MATKLSILAGRLAVDESALAVLKSLTNDEIAALDEVVATAMQAQDNAINTGFQEALQSIPRPLRGRAAAMMGVRRG